VVDRGLTFPVAYGVTREESAVLGAWWDRDRGFIQPAEFLLGRGGIVLGSMYASGPVGRMGADEAVRLITMREGRRVQIARHDHGDPASSYWPDNALLPRRMGSHGLP
jgi:hypothetical protein